MALGFGRGRKRIEAPKEWICPECRRPGDEGYCPKCGKAMESWKMTTKCPKCLDIVEDLSFCPRCGVGLVKMWNIMPDVATIQAMGKKPRRGFVSWSSMSRKEKQASIRVAIMGLLTLLAVLFLWGE